MVAMEPTGAGYAAATESLRSATKWLLAAAAGVAGLLVAGLQLGGLGSLSSDDRLRLVIAVISLLLALVAVGAVIWRAAALLADEWITLAQLTSKEFRERLNSPLVEQPDTTRTSLPATSPAANQVGSAQGAVTVGTTSEVPVSPRRPSRERRRPPKKLPAGDVRVIYAELVTYREELYGDVAESPEDLYRQLIAVNDRLRAIPRPHVGSAERSLTLRQPPTPIRASGRVPAYTGPRPSDRAVELRAATKTVVDFANYRRTRANFDVLRKTLMITAPIVVAGLVSFAIAGHPPASTTGSHQTPSPSAPVPTTESPPMTFPEPAVPPTQ
ncbi:hypothetical protein [Rhodococcus sp. M8-35]|uniref:hypothetical protein n=1 Tax=Rhodococcus sp. M8-35 TaxID=3058401 RepID=UPI002ED167AE